MRVVAAGCPRHAHGDGDPMTTRYLMRLGKTPFDVVDPFLTLERNRLGTNSGNLVYGAAAHKLFSTADTVVDANHYRINAGMAAQVNDEYDGFILPLANAFRPEFEGQLLRTAQFLERLRIPFLMLSGGAQLPLDGDPAALKAMEPTIRRFARAVLNGSSALSVRGEMTADYLASLGFHDVEVVGCPSLALHGPGHRVEVPETLRHGAPIAYNLETKDPFGGDLVEDAEAHYAATYIPQEHGTLELMLWASEPYVATDPRLPLERSHPQFTASRAEFFIDAYPWFDRLATMDFSFGARAHGQHRRDPRRHPRRHARPRLPHPGAGPLPRHPVPGPRGGRAAGLGAGALLARGLHRVQPRACRAVRDAEPLHPRQRVRAHL